MKNCINCGAEIKNGDRYCRRCGNKIWVSGYYIFVNIVSVLLIVGIVFMLILFVLSYIV